MFKNELISTMESLRRDINKTAKEKGFLNKETIKKSKKLDKLINKYNKAN